MGVPSILKRIVIPFMTIARHEITLPYVSPEHQTADVFTKALSRQCNQFIIDKLMLLD